MNAAEKFVEAYTNAVLLSLLDKPQPKRGKPGCKFCGGNGVVAYSAGGDNRLDECGCVTEKV